MPAGHKALAAIAGLAALALAFLSYIGWFGGPIYSEVPAAGGRAPRVAAVVLSGDMGFRLGMGRAIAKRLAARGIPVVGINSLTFLREPRSAAEAAGLVAGAMARAEAMAPGARLVLIGQSLGADTLQLALDALPPAQRRPIALVALVVPSRTVRLQASPSEIFPVSSPEFDGLPSASRLTWAPMLCVQGKEEKDSLCPWLRQPNAVRVALPGGHPLGRDAGRLAATLIGAIRVFALTPAGALR